MRHSHFERVIFGTTNTFDGHTEGCFVDFLTPKYHGYRGQHEHEIKASLHSMRGVESSVRHGWDFIFPTSEGPGSARICRASLVGLFRNHFTGRANSREDKHWFMVRDDILREGAGEWKVGGLDLSGRVLPNQKLRPGAPLNTALGRYNNLWWEMAQQGQEPTCSGTLEYSNSREHSPNLTPETFIWLDAHRIHTLHQLLSHTWGDIESLPEYCDKYEEDLRIFLENFNTDLGRMAMDYSIKVILVEGRDGKP